MNCVSTRTMNIWPTFCSRERCLSVCCAQRSPSLSRWSGPGCWYWSEAPEAVRVRKRTRSQGVRIAEQYQRFLFMLSKKQKTPQRDAAAAKRQDLCTTEALSHGEKQK